MGLICEKWMLLQLLTTLEIYRLSKCTILREVNRLLLIGWKDYELKILPALKRSTLKHMEERMRIELRSLSEPPL